MEPQKKNDRKMRKYMKYNIIQNFCARLHILTKICIYYSQLFQHKIQFSNNIQNCIHIKNKNNIIQ